MPLLAALISERDLGNAPISIAVRGPRGLSVGCAFGRWPSGPSVTAADRFYVASLTKQLTGAAIALLVRDGVLDPDAQIPVEILPLWPIRPTVRQLLHHVGGLPGTDAYQSALGHAPWTDAHVLAQLRTLAGPATPLGAAFVYSNFGYIALARIIEAASRTSFADFVSTRILAPLGISGMAIGQNEVALASPQLALLGPSLPHSTGDGGLWSTAGAFAAWLDAQNRDALGVASMVEQDHLLLSGEPVRYGWGVGLREFRGHPLYMHGGGWTGAWAMAVRCPARQLSVVVLASDPREEQLSALADAVLEALADGHLEEDGA